MQVFFFVFLHKTYNATKEIIRRTVEENEQTANEKKSDYNQHTHTEIKKKKRKKLDIDERIKI